MSNTLPSTSHAANKEMTAEIRQQHHAKIISALEVLGEGIYEEIADYCGMEKHQIGRRLKELVDAGKIYNTLKTGLTSTNRKANKYAIRSATTIIPTPEINYKDFGDSGADYANKLIAQTSKGILKQQSLFNNQ